MNSAPIAPFDLPARPAQGVPTIDVVLQERRFVKLEGDMPEGWQPAFQMRGRVLPSDVGDVLCVEQIMLATANDLPEIKEAMHAFARATECVGVVAVPPGQEWMLKCNTIPTLALKHVAAMDVDTPAGMGREFSWHFIKNV